MVTYCLIMKKSYDNDDYNDDDKNDKVTNDNHTIFLAFTFFAVLAS